MINLDNEYWCDRVFRLSLGGPYEYNEYHGVYVLSINNELSRDFNTKEAALDYINHLLSINTPEGGTLLCPRGIEGVGGGGTGGKRNEI